MSEQVTALQRRLGVAATGEWNDVTLGALAAYQGSGRGRHRMLAHGHPDAPTLVNLGYYEPSKFMPAAQSAHVLGLAERPSSLGRDLSALSNSIPRWIWITAGIAALGAAIYVHKQSKGRAP
jgi:hypothetical protein